QHAQAEAHVLRQRLPQRAAHRLAALLLEPQLASELDARTALGLGPREPCALQVVGAQLHVRAELLLHLVVDRVAAGEPGAARADGGEVDHAASGRAAAPGRSSVPWSSGASPGMPPS